MISKAQCSELCQYFAMISEELKNKQFNRDVNTKLVVLLVITRRKKERLIKPTKDMDGYLHS